MNLLLSVREEGGRTVAQELVEVELGPLVVVAGESIAAFDGALGDEHVVALQASIAARVRPGGSGRRGQSEEADQGLDDCRSEHFEM